MRVIRVQAEDFDIGAETAALLAGCAGAGAVASFLGVVRSTAERPLEALTLEHYPAMTGLALEKIAAEAEERFALLGCTIVHRFGRLVPGENIVLVLAVAAHRQPSLDATNFLIDWLKTSAPFWKKEDLIGGESQWVNARTEDEAAASRW